MSQSPATPAGKQAINSEPSTTKSSMEKSTFTSKVKQASLNEPSPASTYGDTVGSSAPATPQDALVSGKPPPSPYLTLLACFLFFCFGWSHVLCTSLPLCHSVTVSLCHSVSLALARTEHLPFPQKKQCAGTLALVSSHQAIIAFKSSLGRTYNCISTSYLPPSSHLTLLLLLCHALSVFMMPRSSFQTPVVLPLFRRHASFPSLISLPC